MPKHDDIFRVKADNEVIAVAPKCHQPFRTLDVGGQPNLKRFIEAVGSLVGDRVDWPTPTRP
jgi:hypothetical protein